jgi:hypothetical protein
VFTKKKLKNYEFTITIQGVGYTQEQGWRNAVEAFMDNPGLPNDQVDVTDAVTGEPTDDT